VAAWQAGNHLIICLEDILAETALITHLATYENLTDEYFQLREVVSRYDCRPEFTELRQRVSPLIAALKERVKAECVEPDPGFSRASDYHVTSSSCCTSAPSRLQLDLPKFSGDMLDWRELWHIFSAHIEREIDLEDYKNINCLKVAIISEDPYGICMKSLL